METLWGHSFFFLTDGVTHLMHHSFSNERLCFFSSPQFDAILLPYVQLQHTVKAQGGPDLWTQSPTPVFNYMFVVISYKEFIALYSMPLKSSWDQLMSVISRWEKDIWGRTMGRGSLSGQTMLPECGSMPFAALFASAGALHTSKAVSHGQEETSHLYKMQ